MAWNLCEPEAGKYSQKCVDPSAHRVGVKGEGKVARQDRKQKGDTGTRIRSAYRTYMQASRLLFSEVGIKTPIHYAPARRLRISSYDKDNTGAEWLISSNDHQGTRAVCQDLGKNSVTVSYVSTVHV